MEEIVDYHVSFYNSIKKGEKSWVDKELKEQKIKILTGFIENIMTVKKFYREMYQSPKVVLVGVNPGRLGAGKTGIPFIDYNSLSKLTPDVSNKDTERSGAFIFEVINEIGIKKFFQNVYMTNISWLGFEKNKKNFNYYKLPEHLKNEFIKGFIHEMKIVQPKIIFPLSQEVESDIHSISNKINFPYMIGKRMNHPYWCSFEHRKEKCKEDYVNRILHEIEFN